MEFAELRNSVEHVAAAVEREVAGGEESSDAVYGETAKSAILVFGQCLVSIAESLHGIKEAVSRMR